ncbi:hypothetical protein KEM54_001163 [Ascosphaera aggregata]|nr:hypothetical protein KEM54_001163 [Ascosphaera aggregata]
MGAAEEQKILPQDGQRNILITSALPYVNNVPHLGNIVGSVLSADVFARYQKACGRPCLFVCGTDEYGTATETKALEEKVSPEELCTKYNKIHKEVYEWFNIGFDIFGRTPTQKHTEIAQSIFKRLWDNGFLVEKTAEQPYCEQHGSFLADRYVEGTCPYCGYDDARGDQCDKCGRLLDPFDLINPRCKLDGATPVRRATKHIHLRLDLLQPEIEKWARRAMEEGRWPKNSKVITESWLKEERFEQKVLYVWFEACIGYPSITANYTSEWEQWWRNPDNVQLYQFLGKDNVPFHSVIFPGCQIGTRDTWTQVNHLSTTEYLNYENGKFSKSRGIGVFGNNAKETGIAADVWRYYLLKNRPETGDTQFEWRAFVDANNSELLAKLGNLVNRVVKLVGSPKAYSSVVPEFKTDGFEAAITEFTTLLRQYIDSMESVHLRQGTVDAMKIVEAGNLLIQKNKLDNSLIANDPKRAASVVGIVLNLIALIASVFSPYLPATANSIMEQLNAPLPRIPSLDDIKDGWKPDLIKPGHQIGKAKYLFSMIDPKKADEWREHFGGSQEERKKKAEEAARIAAKKAANKAKKKEKKDKKAEGKPAKIVSAKANGTSQTSQAAGNGDSAKVEQVTEDLKNTTISS